MNRKIYPHYCPVARTLEAVGDRWSILIVRDLLRRPRRFTDLLRSVGGITPRWLTLRLRELEAAGVVDRERREDRREVWYRLTPKGRDLRPVVEAMLLWGLRHAMRPPLPGEAVDPELSLMAVATSLNARGVRPDGPRTWALRFERGEPQLLRFDGGRWESMPGETPADVHVEATVDAWMAFLTASRGDERAQALERLRVTGAPRRVSEFVGAFGVSDRAAGGRPSGPPRG